MKISIIVLLILFPIALRSQSTTTWEVSLAGDWAWSLEQTTDDGFIIAGRATTDELDTLPKHGTIAGQFHWLITKLSSGGKVEWKRRFREWGNARAESVAQMPDGGFVVTGDVILHDSSGTYKGHNSMIARLRADGTTLWTRAFGGLGNDLLYDIKPTHDGGVIAVGCSNSADSLIPDRTQHRSADYWIIKLNAEGETEWEKLYGGIGWDSAEGVCQTPDGGYLVITDNARLLRLDSAGEMLWERDYYRLAWASHFNEIQPTHDGGYMIAGYTEAPQAPGFAGQRDVWVAKVNGLGWIEWSQILGSPEVEGATSIDVTNDGGCVVGGYGPKRSYWMMKFGPDAKVRWQKWFPDFKNQGQFTVRQTRTGGYAVAGRKPDTTAPSSKNFWVRVMGEEQGENGP